MSLLYFHTYIHIYACICKYKYIGTSVYYFIRSVVTIKSNLFLFSAPLRDTSHNAPAVRQTAGQFAIVYKTKIKACYILSSYKIIQ